MICNLDFKKLDQLLRLRRLQVWTNKVLTEESYLDRGWGSTQDQSSFSFWNETQTRQFRWIRNGLSERGDKAARRISFKSTKEVTKLEDLIDELDAQLPQLTTFILPGGGKCSAHLHMARTICRRAERMALPLADCEDLDRHLGFRNVFSLFSSLIFLLPWFQWFLIFLPNEPLFGFRLENCSDVGFAYL